MLVVKSFGGGSKPPAASDDGIGGQEQIRRAFREQGVKDILERRNRSRMADKEVARTAEENNFSGRIRNASIGRRDRTQNKAAGKVAKSSNAVQKRDELIQRTRKEHAIRRIVGRKETAGYPILSFFRSSGIPGNNRRVRTLSSFIKFMWENAKTTIMTLGAGGAATVIILILFVFFTIGAITFSNNSPDTSISDPEEIEYFIPDLAGSPTREAIVKAAAKEVGNVGGEKFWRWYGFKSHVHWCACFTSYIAAECGCIQSGICPKSAIVDDWISFYKTSVLTSAPSKMHLHTEVHFVWNMAEGIEPPTFSSTILRIDFRPKRSKQALGTEVGRCTWSKTSVSNA